jgi:hypothetical protein
LLYGLSAALLVLLVFTSHIATYKIVWLSARSLGPAVVLVGVALLWRKTGPQEGEREGELCSFLLMALASMVALVQYNFSAPIYFCYVAPFVALTAAALVRGWSPGWLPVHAAVAIFYLAFAALRMNPAYIFNLGNRPDRYVADGRLDMRRGGGLRVPKAEADSFNGLVARIRDLSRGEDLWVGPDAPEVYFLAEKKNPTRFFYAFQDRDYGDWRKILRRIDSRRVRLVALQKVPGFSRQYSVSMMEEFAVRFPESADYGLFLLRWRVGP